jgi:hypothetical protein
MLDLKSSRWCELEHAYGSASDVPKLIEALSSLPKSSGNSEPWFSLWSSLAHQGDVYSASFAAVPHVIRLLETSPLTAGAEYFHFPAWIEICRKKKMIHIPEDIAPAYFDALSKLPSLVAAASAREWDAEFLQSALCAIAAAKGHADVAEAVQEVTPEIAKEFMEWFGQR